MSHQEIWRRLRPRPLFFHCTSKSNFVEVAAAARCFRYNTPSIGASLGSATDDSARGRFVRSWLGIIGVAAVGLVAISEPSRCKFILCEENEPSAEIISDIAAGDEEDDPYENLPEDDEETDCTMCKTFRQGPCRPFWRKLERCFKDHESEDNGSAKCMRYFSPHQVCLMEYTNLYQLISLDLKQELIADVEQAVTPAERRTFRDDHAEFSVDWKLWREFYEEMGPSFRQTVPHHRRTEPSSEPLWKRLPPTSDGTHLEPVLLQTKATLSMTPPQPNDGDDSSSKSDVDRMILKLAYAIDQDGFVIGLSYNSKYGDLLDLTKKSSKTNDIADDSDANVTNEEEHAAAISEPLPEKFGLDFYILPGECQSIRVCAMYAENPVMADPEKPILDVLLYKSKSISLQRIAGAPAATESLPAITKSMRKVIEEQEVDTSTDLKLTD